MELVRTKTGFSVFKKSGTIQQSNTKAPVKQILFVNTGEVVVLINSVFRLNPGDKLTIAQDHGCYDATDYNFKFLIGDPDSTGTLKKLDTITTVYVWAG